MNTVTPMLRYGGYCLMLPISEKLKDVSAIHHLTISLTLKDIPE